MSMSSEYLAGYFDADGCVIATLRHNKYLSSRAAVVGNNRELLGYLKETFGGNVYKMHGKARLEKAHMWVAAGRAALPFLLFIQRHVVLKKDRVSLCVEIAESLQQSTRVVPEDVLRHRYISGLSVCLLNQVDKTNPRETKTIARLRRLIGCISG